MARVARDIDSSASELLKLLFAFLHTYPQSARFPTLVLSLFPSASFGALYMNILPSFIIFRLISLSNQL